MLSRWRLLKQKFQNLEPTLPLHRLRTLYPPWSTSLSPPTPFNLYIFDTQQFTCLKSLPIGRSWLKSDGQQRTPYFNCMPPILQDWKRRHPPTVYQFHSRPLEPPLTLRHLTITRNSPPKHCTAGTVTSFWPGQRYQLAVCWWQSASGHKRHMALYRPPTRGIRRWRSSQESPHIVGGDIRCFPSAIAAKLLVHELRDRAERISSTKSLVHGGLEVCTNGC